MKRNRIGVFGLTALLAVLVVAPVAHAQWRATVGAESDDLGRRLWPFFQTKFGFTLVIASRGPSPPMKSTR